jgi:hypothetical protein
LSILVALPQGSGDRATFRALNFLLSVGSMCFLIARISAPRKKGTQHGGVTAPYVCGHDLLFQGNFENNPVVGPTTLTGYAVERVIREEQFAPGSTSIRAGKRMQHGLLALGV